VHAVVSGVEVRAAAGDWIARGVRRAVSRPTLAYTYEIIELELGQKLVMRTAEGPFPLETTYTWEAVGPATTRRTLRNRGEPTGFSKLIGPLMERAMRRANRKDLERLKQVLEAGTA
jgi:hypothetical protein